MYSNYEAVANTPAGHNLPGIALQFVTQNPFIISKDCCICVAKRYDICKACMLHSRVGMQALRWVVEVATQETYSKLGPAHVLCR